MTLAIFDLDNTLLRGDSDYAWGEFLIDRGVVDKTSYERENERYYKEYTDGTLDIHRFLTFVLQPLTRLDRAALDALHNDYMQTKIQPMITPAAHKLIQEHRDQGHRPLIMSATNSFITRPIARAFGVDDLLATEPEEVDGRFTGRVAGTPCYRDGKVTRLKAWLREHSEPCSGAGKVQWVKEWVTRHALSLDDSWFYSDSHNDLPLLELVDHPVAVNPDDRLRRQADTKGWRIIDLA